MSTEVISKIKNLRSKEKKSTGLDLLEYGMPVDFTPQYEFIEMF